MNIEANDNTLEGSIDTSDNTTKDSKKEFKSETKYVKDIIFRTKRSYVPVELDQRMQLIKIIEEEGVTIKEAANALKINYSTAKHIVKLFKKTGDVKTWQMNKR
jgi:hypothetical protein